MPSARGVVRSVLFLVAASTVSAAARAAPPKAEDSPAEAAFREGRALMATGDLRKACDKLAESQRLEPAAGTLLNLAECVEKRGLTASAWALYVEAAEAAAQRGRPDWQKLAETRSAALSKIVPRVTYEVSEEDLASGIILAQDGVPARPNEPLPVDPGAHTISAVVKGREPFSKAFQIRNGDKLQVRIAWPKPSRPADEKGAPPVVVYGGAEPSGDGARNLGLVIGAAGIAGLVTGTVTGILAIRFHDEAVSRCASYPDRCPSDGSGTRANEDATRFATVSTISFVAGGALLAMGAVLYFTAPAKKSAMRLAPAITKAASGILLGGDF